MLRRLVAPTLLSLALATSASAGEPTETLRTLFDHANRVLLDPGTTDETRMAALRARVHADGVRVAFASERVQGAQATVVTTLETRAGGSVPVEYRMRRRESGWAVVDVVVEGLSLANSYRAQFQRVMQNGTYADLVARLRATASMLTPSP